MKEKYSLKEFVEYIDQKTIYIGSVKILHLLDDLGAKYGVEYGDTKNLSLKNGSSWVKYILSNELEEYEIKVVDRGELNNDGYYSNTHVSKFSIYDHQELRLSVPNFSGVEYVLGEDDTTSGCCPVCSSSLANKTIWGFVVGKKDTCINSYCPNYEHNFE